MLLRRVARVAAAAAALWALPAAPAEAHGLPSPPGVPVPGYLFAWAAAIVLVASFAGLGALWRSPALEGARSWPMARVPLSLDGVCGAIGMALFALVVYAGLSGTADPDRNFAPTFVYVIFWVGLVPASLFLGNVFSLFNPWRAAGRAIGRLSGRMSPHWVAPPLRYPARLGRWPAVLGLAGFAYLELVYPRHSEPAVVAYAALVYAGVQLIGMSLFGVEAWTRRGDGFAVYYGLLAQLSPFRREGRWFAVRPFLSGLTELEVTAGTVALLCVMIGTTSFDGLSSTVQWSELEPVLIRTFGSPEAVAAVGLAGMILLVGAVYRLGVAGMRTIDRTHRNYSALFVHSLVPIAAAYVLAHYFTFLVFNGQAIGVLAANPLGVGTATASIDYSLISASSVWYFQVGALIAGHVGGLVLAHDRALAVFGNGRKAMRSQYWMLTVMVGFTSLGLFLLASIKR